MVAADDDTEIASSIRYHVFACSAWLNVAIVVPALFWMKIWLAADSWTRAAVPEALRISANRNEVDGSVEPGL